VSPEARTRPAMHIPDGYLSPSTCAVMYGSALPFWAVALRKLKRTLNTRLIPRLSVFSALSFIIMMFNVPLPGGTTGHAVGVGIATVVLGPWASIVAISTAIFIQAIFFGDGGITTFGANCFNMAIVGSLVAYLVYRAASGRAALTSTRRVLAAAVAGYIGINASALCAGIELGIQPLLFKSASGAPLYAPYPPHIAIPAMMIGHLAFAGLAELVISGSVVAYLQRTHPFLLNETAPRALRAFPGELKQPEAGNVGPPASGWSAVRSLWAGLALLMILTPLGILAAGTAWGEWSAHDFSDPAARHKIAAASAHVPPPSHVPHGLARLSSLWSAPFPGYFPSFIPQRAFGYFMSAIFGAGVILMVFLLASWFLGRRAAKRGRPDQIDPANS
jgi:cobalt/nickel transport system permease protein